MHHSLKSLKSLKSKLWMLSPQFTQIGYTETISCGKGRDMGFNSILTFETKISCGNGEVSVAVTLSQALT